MVVTELQNELARIRIDILNTGAHNEQLKTAVAAVLSTLKVPSIPLSAKKLDVCFINFVCCVTGT